MLTVLKILATKTFYQKKYLLEEAATIRRFEYLPPGNELKSKVEL